MPLPDIPGTSMKCFDVIKIDESIDVIDCLSLNESEGPDKHCTNYFYIVNHNAEK